MPQTEEVLMKRKRESFLDRPKGFGSQEVWDTTYQTAFVQGYKPRTLKNTTYRSPYRQQSKCSIHARDQAEKHQRLATLKQPSIISEPLVRGLTNLCEMCSPDLRRMRVYSKDLPTVPRLALPSDITEPKFIQLQAKHWKGIDYPFADPRFDPFLPVCLDASIAPSTLDPFKYCQRRRTFPQYNRCPNRPMSEEAVNAVESLGMTSIESKLYNRRWAKKRFPKPILLTRLW